MKKIKFLVPIAAVSAGATVIAPLTACKDEPTPPEPTPAEPALTVEGLKTTYSAVLGNGGKTDPITVFYGTDDTKEDVTDNVTIELDKGSKVTYNKTKHTFQWSTYLAKGTYEINFVVKYNEITSDKITFHLDIGNREPKLTIYGLPRAYAYGTVAQSGKTSNPITIWYSKPDIIQDVDVTDEAEISISCSNPEFTNCFSFSKDHYVTWNDQIYAGTYDIVIAATYSNTNITTSDSFKLKINPRTAEIRVNNLEQSYTGKVAEPGMTEALTFTYFHPNEPIEEDITSKVKVAFSSSIKDNLTFEDSKIKWNDKIDAGSHPITLIMSYDGHSSQRTFTINTNTRDAKFNFTGMPESITATVGSKTTSQQMKVEYVDPTTPVIRDVTNSVVVTFDQYKKSITYSQGIITIGDDLSAMTGQTITATFSYQGFTDKKTFKLVVNERQAKVEAKDLETSLTGIVGQEGEATKAATILYTRPDVPEVVDVSKSTNLTVTATDNIVTYDKTKKKLVWSNNLDSDTYKLTITISYKDEQREPITQELTGSLRINPRVASVYESEPINITVNKDGSLPLRFFYQSSTIAQDEEITETATITPHELPAGITFNAETKTLTWTAQGSENLEYDAKEILFDITTKEGVTYESVPAVLNLEIKYASVSWDYVGKYATRGGTKLLHKVFKEDCDGNEAFPNTLIGLKKTLNVNSRNHDTIVIDENHDTISGQTKHAALTIKISNCFTSSYNTTGSSSHWPDCSLRNRIIPGGDIYESLDSKLKPHLKQVHKVQYNERGEKTESDDIMSIMSMCECLTEPAKTGEGTLYRYFTDGFSSDIPKGSAQWARSPGYQEGSGSWNHVFAINKNDGSYWEAVISSNLYVEPIFFL